MKRNDGTNVSAMLEFFVFSFILSKSFRHVGTQVSAMLEFWCFLIYSMIIDKDEAPTRRGSTRDHGVFSYDNLKNPSVPPLVH